MAAVKPYNWKKLLVISVLATYAYVLMEWLFFVTMPSFMSGMSLLSKVGILFTASGILALLFLVPCLVWIILHLLFARYRFSRVFFWLATLFPALVLGLLLLLLVDNFTYTIFHFGIVTSTGIWRGAYLAIFLLLVAPGAERTAPVSESWGCDKFFPEAEFHPSGCFAGRFRDLWRGPI